MPSMTPLRRRAGPRLAVGLAARLAAGLAALPLLGACGALEPGEPVDDLTVPESNDEMMEEQQEEIREDAVR